MPEISDELFKFPFSLLAKYKIELGLIDNMRNNSIYSVLDWSFNFIFIKNMPYLVNLKTFLFSVGPFWRYMRLLKLVMKLYITKFGRFMRMISLLKK